MYFYWFQPQKHLATSGKIGLKVVGEKSPWGWNQKKKGWLVVLGGGEKNEWGYHPIFSLKLGVFNLIFLDIYTMTMCKKGALII